jgi:hypothetical protein
MALPAETAPETPPETPPPKPSEAALRGTAVSGTAVACPFETLKTVPSDPTTRFAARPPVPVAVVAGVKTVCEDAGVLENAN